MTENVVSSGVEGLDQVLRGGLPRNEATLIRGASGTGKTTLALAFAGQTGASAPCVLATFDEDPVNLASYLASSDGAGSVTILDCRPDPEIREAGGGIELGGVLTRIDHALDKSGADRLVLDAVDVLFDSFRETSQVRLDLMRLFAWCRERRVTLLVTAGESEGYRLGTGLLDYASHCAINLSQSIEGGLMTRTLYVRKRRGGGHGTNEYPYLIDENGILLDPVTELRQSSSASTERLSTGHGRLDEMLGAGLLRGAALMISGTSGTGKSLLAASIAAATAAAGERVIYCTFEEPVGNLVRDTASIGIDLATPIANGTLTVSFQRSIERGLEEHLIQIGRKVKENNVSLILIDPVSALGDVADHRTLKNGILRLVTSLKNAGITTVMTESSFPMIVTTSRG